jgi:hypothetical protein
MEMVPAPPLESNDEGALVTLKWHFVEVGAVTAVVAEVQAAHRVAAAPASNGGRQRVARRSGRTPPTRCTRLARN